MRFSIIILFIALLFISCSSKNESREQIISGEAQGTTYTIKYIGNKSVVSKNEIDSLLSNFDNSLSTYVPNSLISQLNNSDKVEFDDWLGFMFTESKRLNLISSGAFDPTIGPLIKAWGFDFSDGQVLDSSKVDSLRELCGFSLFQKFGDTLYKNHSAYLNFNAIAQGYAVDLIAEKLDNDSIEDYYVELGGELKVKGLNAKDSLWKIGIDRPIENNDSRELSFILPLENKAMATSGNYRKFYEKNGVKYSHTIDPITGFPVTHSLLSATVIHEDCYIADAMATSFMVMGLEKTKAFLSQNDDFDAILIYEGEGGMKTFVSENVREKAVELKN